MPFCENRQNVQQGSCSGGLSDCPGTLLGARRWSGDPREWGKAAARGMFAADCIFSHPAMILSASHATVRESLLGHPFLSEKGAAAGLFLERWICLTSRKIARKVPPAGPPSPPLCYRGSAQDGVIWQKRAAARRVWRGIPASRLFARSDAFLIRAWESLQESVPESSRMGNCCSARGGFAGSLFAPRVAFHPRGDPGRHEYQPGDGREWAKSCSGEAVLAQQHLRNDLVQNHAELHLMTPEPVDRWHS